MRVVLASVLVSLFLFGCSEEETASTGAADATAPASEVAKTDRASGASDDGSAQSGSAAAAGGASPSAAAGAAPLSSSRSSPRVSELPAPAATRDAPATQANDEAQPNDAQAKAGSARTGREAAPASTPARNAANGGNAANASPAGGEYTIEQGDTLVAIARAHDVDAKDLARWNGIDDPRRLQIGQKIRLSPPGG